MAHGKFPFCNILKPTFLFTEFSANFSFSNYSSSSPQTSISDQRWTYNHGWEKTQTNKHHLKSLNSHSIDLIAVTPGYYRIIHHSITKTACRLVPIHKLYDQCMSHQCMTIQFHNKSGVILMVVSDNLVRNEYLVIVDHLSIDNHMNLMKINGDFNFSQSLDKMANL